MADYWGTAEICRRMNVCPATIRRWYRERGFLQYKRRKTWQPMWYTNDALIMTWELRECERQAKTLRLQRNRPRQAKS